MKKGIEIIVEAFGKEDYSVANNCKTIAGAKSYAKRVVNKLNDSNADGVIYFVRLVNHDTKELYFTDDNGNWFVAEYDEYYPENNPAPVADPAPAPVEVEPAANTESAPSFVIDPTWENSGERVRIIEHSQNEKTGDIGQSYSARKTCPITACAQKCGAIACKGDSCYCQSGYFTRKNWNQTDEGLYNTVPVMYLPELMKKLFPASRNGEYFRHNIGGDMCKPGTNDLDPVHIGYLAKAFKDLRAFTYTHCAKTPANLKIAHDTTKAGFTVNISCDNLAQVRMARNADCLSVLTVDSMSAPNMLVDGLKFKQCPATIDGSEMTCKTCGKCYKADRDYTIVFPLHGANAEKARKTGRFIKL